MVRRWSATVDRRWPSLTGGRAVPTPRGTTHVVTRGILMIRCQVAGTRYCSAEVAENVRWQYEVAMAGQ
ncbi:hypothetical protein Tco_1380827 [Tanacetum coccineum]